MTILRYFIGVISLLPVLASTASGQNSADPERFFSDGKVILFVKALSVHEFVKADQIVESGVKIDAFGKGGVTPLWWAVNTNDFQSFEFLLKKGANPLAQVSDGFDIMELCAGNENRNFLIEALKHGGRANIISQYYRRTPIFAAATANQIENVDLLLKTGAYINISDPYGMTPVMAAACVNSYEAVVLLLEKDANCEWKDRNGQSLIDIVKSSQIREDSERYKAYLATVELLKKKGLM